MIVSLPYKAGVWISAADKTETKAAEKELAALEHIIDRHAQGMFESAFVHEVMVETCTRKQEWPAWASQTGRVPEDCNRVVAALSEKLGARDMEAYRRSVMTVAVEVARTFREFDFSEPWPVRLGAGLRRFMDRLAGLAHRGGYDMRDWRSVSFAEDIALDKLSKALGMQGGGK